MSHDLKYDRWNKNMAGGYPFIAWCPMYEPKLPAIIEFAQLTPTDVFMDLGCGDGRVLIAAAKAVGCRCIGIDCDAHMVEQARQKVNEAGLGHLIEIRHGNIFTADLSDATVFFSYLFYWMNWLVPVLNQYPGKRIITASFHFVDKEKGHWLDGYEKSVKESRRKERFGDVYGYFLREYVLPIEVPAEYLPTKPASEYCSDGTNRRSPCG